MKKPELRDYGIKPKAYRRYQRYGMTSSGSAWGQFSVFFLLLTSIVGGIVTFAVSLILSQDVGAAIMFGAMGMFFLGAIYALVVEQFRDPRIPKGPLGDRINQYEAAVTAWKEAERVRAEAERERLEAQRNAQRSPRGFHQWRTAALLKAQRNAQRRNLEVQRAAARKEAKIVWVEAEGVHSEAQRSAKIRDLEAQRATERRGAKIVWVEAEGACSRGLRKAERGRFEAQRAAVRREAERATRKSEREQPSPRRSTGPRKPELRDYGITPEEYVHYQKFAQDKPGNLDKIKEMIGGLSFLIAGPIVGIVGFFITSNLGGAVAWGFYGFIGGCIPAILAAHSFGALYNMIWRRRKTRLSESRVGISIKQYEEDMKVYSEAIEEAEKSRLEAVRARQEAEWIREEARLEAERIWQAREKAERRKRLDYWLSMRGVQFERELATLYRSHGYQVQTTPTSGDQGVDLILKKGGKTTVVQCKGQKARAGSPIVLSLIGARENNRADHAILACTGGFTQSAIDLANHNRIDLISAEELVEMGKAAPLPQQQQPISEQAASTESTNPVCASCGNGMILRRGRYSRFWGCSTYPKCRFTRRYNQSRRRR